MTLIKSPSHRSPVARVLRFVVVSLKAGASAALGSGQSPDLGSVRLLLLLLRPQLSRHQGCR